MRGVVWLARAGAAVLGVLSAVTLVRLGFETPFIAPLADLLDAYEHVMQEAFGWAEPLLARTFTVIDARTGMHLHLYPQWKHVFLLLVLYFAGETGFCWSSACRGQAVRSGILGLFIAVVLAAALGTIPLGARPPALRLIVPIMLSIGVAILLWRLALAAARATGTPYIDGRRTAGQGTFLAMSLLAIAIPAVLALVAINPDILVAGCVLIGLALANLVSGTLMRSDLNPDAPLGLFLFSAVTGTVAVLVMNAILI